MNTADLREFVRKASDEQLFKINPLDFAAENGISEREAIDLFVQASHEGLFHFSWDILCPGCGLALTTSNALHGLSNHAHCAVCDIEVSVNLDDAIEVSFTVSPSLRHIKYHDPETLSLRELMWMSTSSRCLIHPELLKIRDSLGCAQGLTDQDGTEALTVSVSEGIYRFACLSHHIADLIEVTQGGKTRLTVEVNNGVLTFSTHRVAPGELNLEIKNLTGGRIAWTLFKRPSMSFSQLPKEWITRFRPFLTGKRLVSTQSFRDLYRSDTVSPGGELAIRSVTLLFTDLKESTSLYDRIGDLNAFSLVQEHFQILSEAVVENDGAIIKTIGDAIMASFPEPTHAIRATTQMHRRLEERNRHHAEPLLLKVGIHEGPCIAVNQNELLDYFGQTVNMAARIQGLAKAGETVISDSVVAAPGVTEMLEKEGLILIPEKALLKGISGEAKVYRAQVAMGTP